MEGDCCPKLEDADGLLLLPIAVGLLKFSATSYAFATSLPTCTSSAACADANCTSSETSNEPFLI